jgi:hypothetical protein
MKDRWIMRIAALSVVMLGSLALASSAAQATFHEEKVSEVMLASSSGAPSVQFVGLLDLGGTEEVFPHEVAPYRLVIYDAAGVELGQQTLNPSGLRSAAAFGARYVISTAAADSTLGTTDDERLRISLPVSAGQACYQANLTPPALSCLTWGTISRSVPTNSVGVGSANGPTPPNGESDQRRPNGTVFAARPFAGVTLIGHTAKVDIRGRARIRLHCPESTAGFCQGQLALTPAGGGSPLGHASLHIANSRTASVQIKLSHATLSQLQRRGHLTVRARIVAHDGAGTSETDTSRLALIRGH